MTKLAEGANKAGADVLERFWIAKLRATDPSIGYNGTTGGDGAVPTSESRAKMSESARRSFTPERRKQISDFHRGRKLSAEHRQNLREGHHRKRRINNEKLIHLYETGLGCRKLARLMGFTPNGIWQIFRSLGYKLRPRNKGVLLTEAMVDLYATGKNRQQIAEELGLDSNTVGKWLKVAGIKTRSSRLQFSVKDEDILSLRNAGLLHREIAEKLGCGRSGVTYRLKTMENRLSALEA